MHILYLLAAPGIPLGGPSGSSCHVAAMVQAFADLGHRVSLCVARVTGPLPPEWQSDPQVRVLEVPAPAAPFWARGRVEAEKRHAWAVGRAAVEWLGDDPPDLIYERYSLFSAAGSIARERWRAPWVLEVNAPLRLERVRFEGLRDDRRVRAAERAVLRSADRLLAVSTPLASYLADEVAVPAARVAVVPNGVDLERFQAAARHHETSMAAGREQGGARAAGAGQVEQGLTPVIGFAGSLKPWHGLDRWVDVFARVQARVPDVRGLIVGDGPERERMRQMLEGRGLEHCVTFTGHAAPVEVAAHLAGMDLLLAPYPRLEPFYFCPLKVLEALATGVPVVTTAQGDLPSLVGEAGALMAPEDLAGLAMAIVGALEETGRLERWRAATATQVVGRDWRDVAAQVLAEVSRHL